MWDAEYHAWRRVRVAHLARDVVCLAYGATLPFRTGPNTEP
jgi:hypothetical protein